MAAIETAAWFKETLRLKLGIRSAQPDLQLRLFKNDYTPDSGSTPANFTEATLAGYASISLTPLGWTVSSFPAYAEAIRTTSPKWTFPGPVAANTTIYGYYVTDEATIPATVMVAERWATPHIVPTGGEEYYVTPTIRTLQVAS